VIAASIGAVLIGLCLIFLGLVAVAHRHGMTLLYLGCAVVASGLFIGVWLWFR
jgi:hypothetical protein